MAPDAIGFYYNRNRNLLPHLGRFQQRDLNESAAPVMAALASQGQTLEALAEALSSAAHFSDGANLLAAYGANPLDRNDSLGLEWHHLYPCYLGGSRDGPGVELSHGQHQTFHSVLGDALGGGPYESQREVWAALSDSVRKNILRTAADAAGIDISDPLFESALDSAYSNAIHGTNVPRGRIPVGNRFTVSMKPTGGPRALVFDSIPGANKIAALAKGAAIASVVLSAAPLLVLFELDNEHLRSLAIATMRAQSRAGGLSLADEAFGLMDFYALTQEPVSAGWAWDLWADGAD